MPLTTENCSPDCDEETGLLLIFNITSLVLSDVDKDLGFSDILVNLTFDGNVVKIQKIEKISEVIGNNGIAIQFIDSSVNAEFREQKILLIHSTTRNLCYKLKTCPILLNLSRGCKDLGTKKLEISDCFADAVTCNDFNSQKVTSELEFQAEEKKNALMTICVTVERSPNEELNKLYKQYGTMKKDAVKKRKAALKKKAKKISSGGAGANAEEDIEEEEEEIGDAGECENTNDPCDEFECPDQISDACKVNMVLKEKIYKIFNGNLINIKDKVGPCGVIKCPTATKIAIDLCKNKSVN